MDTAFNPTGIIRVEYYETANGDICIFPPLSRVEAQAKLIRASEAANPDDTVKINGKLPSDFIVGEQLDARALAGDKLQVKEYPYRPFNVGERMEAKRKATRAVEGEEGRFQLDQDEYDARLIAASLGVVYDKLLEEHPAFYDYLAQEVFGRSRISPERLSFFA